MADKHRPEVNLEISSGCFRIATKELIYNLCIIPNRSGLPIVEKIVEGEKQVEAKGVGGSSDSYFQRISQETLRNLVDICRGMLDFEGGKKSRNENEADLQKITEARRLLADLKEVVARTKPVPQIENGIAELASKLQKMKVLVDRSGSISSASTPLEDDQTRLLLGEVLQLVDGIAGKFAGEDSGEGNSSGSGRGYEDFVDRIHALDQVLESSLHEVEKGPAVNIGVFPKRLLEAVLTLYGEIRMKQEDDTLAVDKARKQAAAKAASKVVAVRNPQDMEQLLDELGL